MLVTIDELRFIVAAAVAMLGSCHTPYRGETALSQGPVLEGTLHGGRDIYAGGRGK